MNASFGDRLRELREAAQLNQSELAKRAGVSRQAVWRIENDKREPGWNTVLLLARALGVEITAFVPPSAEELATSSLSDDTTSRPAGKHK